MRSLIANSKNAAIVCHVNADGDALGSSLTWAAYLRQQGLDATIIVPDMYPDSLQWLPGLQQSVRFDKKEAIVKKKLEETDLLCYLDLNTIDRTGDALKKELEKFEGKKILIDHHLDPQLDCDMTISFPELSSTCELVFRLIWQLGGYEAMTKEMATSAYCGMMTDTGAFTYNSTRPEIYYIISLLLEKGIDKDKIYRNFYHTFSISQTRLWGYVLYEKLHIQTPLRASYYTLSKEELRRFEFKKGDAEGLVNKPLNIKGHRLSISLREDTEKPNTVWVSLRSVDSFPCDEMAKRFFNGGGHKNAAGGKLFCSLSEAVKKTKEAIEAYKAIL